MGDLNKFIAVKIAQPCMRLRQKKLLSTTVNCRHSSVMSRFMPKVGNKDVLISNAIKYSKHYNYLVVLSQMYKEKPFGNAMAKIEETLEIVQ